MFHTEWKTEINQRDYVLSPLHAAFIAHATTYRRAVPLFLKVCKNNAELFQLDVGQNWKCELSEPMYRRLQSLLQAGPGPNVVHGEWRRG